MRNKYKLNLIGFLAIMGMGCSDKDTDNTAPELSETIISYTQYGVPHIEAENYEDLGEGLGFVMSQHRMCNVFEGVITARAEKSKYFGPGQNKENIDSDFAHLHLQTYEKAKSRFPDLDENLQSLFEGFAKGFNYGLTRNDDSKQGCEEFIEPISSIDLYALNSSLSYWGFIDRVMPLVGSASLNSISAGLQESLTVDLKGSNGWAIGKNLAENGKGLLLSNTHLPYEGRFQWFEAHLVIPGKLNVYGGFLPGFVTPSLGFNESFAWTHTWSSSLPGTLYSLELTSDNNKIYYSYDNENRLLEAKRYTISVNTGGDSYELVERTLYRSHYGPVIEFSDEGVAIVAKDAPSIDPQIAKYWHSLALAKNIEEAIDLNETKKLRSKAQNIIMVDDTGETFYGDMSSVPHLSQQAWVNIFSNFDKFSNPRYGFVLDGSSSIYEWDSIVPFDEIPKRSTYDYVQNANQSPWLANADQRVMNYSHLYGGIEEEQSPRTRLGLKMLESFKDNAEKVSMKDLEKVMLDKKILLADLVLDDLLERCIAQPTMKLNNDSIDLMEACQVLEKWDRQVTKDSVGAHIFREYAINAAILKEREGCNGQCWKNDFNPLDPINTPSGLPSVSDYETDLHLRALAIGISTLQKLEIPLDAPLKNIQKIRRGKNSIPIAGGIGDLTGSFGTIFTSNENSYVQSGLTPEGYAVNGGDGFILMVEFTSEGAAARSLLLYGQSNDKNSDHYSDQLTLVEKAVFKPVRFKESDIVKNSTKIQVIAVP